MTDLSRQVDNTLNTERIPIIVVPGLMGTKLHFPQKRMYWNPDRPYRDMIAWVRLIGNNKDNLDLSQKAHVMDENSACLRCLERYPDLKKENYLKGWGGLAKGFYLSFLEYLSDPSRKWAAQCPIYAVGYDWRQSVIPTLSSYLTNQVKEILNKSENAKVEKIIILTHSMGGLVTRAALLKEAPWASKVIGVLHTVQPAIGAVAPYRRFFTGWSTQVNDGDGAFQKILGNKPEKFAATASGLPGPLQLLPSNLYPRDFWKRHQRGWARYNGFPSTLWPTDVYDMYLSSSTPPGLIDYEAYLAKKGKQEKIAKDLKSTVEQARKFHEEIKRYRFEGKTWVILSSGVMGDTEISFDPKPNYDGKTTVSDYADQLEEWQKFRGAKATLTAESDGTVPAVSAGALFDKTYDLSKNTPRWVTPDFKDDIRKEVFDVCQKQELRQFQVLGAEHAQCFDSADMLEVVTGIIDVMIARSRNK